MDDDPIAALEARLAAVRAEAVASLPGRADELEGAWERAQAGDAESLEVIRRIAHQIRGIAEDEALRARASAVEEAALGALGAVGREIGDELRRAVLSLLARARRPPAEPPAAPLPREARTDARRLEVLLVDDTASVRKLARLALERLGGHAVSEAGCAKEALALLRERAFDVVLLDAMMPGGSGVEVCRWVRSIPHQSKAKVAMLSAATAEQLGATQHQADAWWQKPLSAGVLVQRVAELVGAPSDD